MKVKVTNDTIIDIERLACYLKMTVDFSGKKYFSYKELREIIKYHRFIKEPDGYDKDYL